MSEGPVTTPDRIPRRANSHEGLWVVMSKRERKQRANSILCVSLSSTVFPVSLCSTGGRGDSLDQARGSSRPSGDLLVVELFPPPFFPSRRFGTRPFFPSLKLDQQKVELSRLSSFPKLPRHQVELSRQSSFPKLPRHQVELSRQSRCARPAKRSSFQDCLKSETEKYRFARQKSRAWRDTDFSDGDQRRHI